MHCSEPLHHDAPQPMKLRQDSRWLGNALAAHISAYFLRTLSLGQRGGWREGKLTCKMGGPCGSVPGELLSGRRLGGLIQKGLLLKLCESPQQRQGSRSQQLN